MNIRNYLLYGLVLLMGVNVCSQLVVVPMPRSYSLFKTLSPSTSHLGDAKLYGSTRSPDVLQRVPLMQRMLLRSQVLTETCNKMSQSTVHVLSQRVTDTATITRPTRPIDDDNEWATSKFNPYRIYPVFLLTMVLPPKIQTRVSHLQAHLHRHLMYRHDFQQVQRRSGRMILQFSYLFVSMESHNDVWIKIQTSQQSSLLRARGGGSSQPTKSKKWTWTEIEPYVLATDTSTQVSDTFLYVDYVSEAHLNKNGALYANIPWHILTERLNAAMLKLIMTMHGIEVTRQKVSLARLKAEMSQHQCSNCPTFYSEFKPVFVAEQIAKWSKKSKTVVNQ